MTYRETLDYIFEKLPMYSRIGDAAFKKDLTNINALCDLIGHPQNLFKSIHIGGTNGKGSTTNMLASCLVEAGYKVGIYTSPHLIDYRERIKIGNQYIPENFVIQFIQKMKEPIERIKPSFFEITVAMAFEYFASENVDIAIIEVGLGGRLDSTNIINPIFSVITNISKDHTKMLGEDLADIAFEKAGIIKPNTPVLIGKKEMPSQSVFENKAATVSAPLYYADDMVSVVLQDQMIEYTVGSHRISISKAPWISSYQIENIKTVIAACAILQQDWFSVNWEQKIVRGIQKHHQNTNFAGRWMHFSQNGISIVLESAHNEAGIKATVRSLQDMTYSQLRIIFGAVNDKDLSSMIDELPTHEASYILTQADIPRAMPVDQLEQLFVQKTSSIVSFKKSIDALDYGINKTEKGELLLILGSIFLVGEMLNHLIEKNSWNT
jgi:dihydrofolate synthase/folylpolyglutamate synthase